MKIKIQMKGADMLKDLYEKFGELVRHNVPLTMTIIVCLAVVMIFWLGGCESKTLSLITPETQVSRGQLQVEYDSEIARLEQELTKLQSVVQLRLQDLDRQDAFKQKLFEIGMASAETGEINPVGIATSLLALLFSGSVMNGLVKDRVISTQKNEITNRLLVDVNKRNIKEEV